MSLQRFISWASQPWMLHGPFAERAVQVLTARVNGVRVPREQVAAIVAERDERRARVRHADRGDRPRGMSRNPRDDQGWYLDGKVAVVPVEGIITKYAGSINGMSQPRGCTPEDLSEAMVSAATNRAVSGVVLDIDSPGGTVAGGEDVVEAVRRAKAIVDANGDGKPIVAMIRDLGASGAYLLASQCHEIYATANAIVGSVGVYQVVWDESEYHEHKGMKAHLVASGPAKGAGAYGTKVTAAHLESFQKEVDRLRDWFVTRAAEGRGMAVDDMAALATGDVWIGADAAKVGLIDGVKGFRELIDELNATV